MFYGGGGGGGYYDAWDIICEGRNGLGYSGKLFCLFWGWACTWFELLWLTSDLATELVSSSYTCDNLVTLLLGGFLFACKFCTSSCVNLIIYVWNSMHIVSIFVSILLIRYLLFSSIVIFRVFIMSILIFYYVLLAFIRMLVYWIHYCQRRLSWHSPILTCFFRQGGLRYCLYWQWELWLVYRPRFPLLLEFVRFDFVLFSFVLFCFVLFFFGLFLCVCHVWKVVYCINFVWDP